MTAVSGSHDGDLAIGPSDHATDGALRSPGHAAAVLGGVPLAIKGGDPAGAAPATAAAPAPAAATPAAAPATAPATAPVDPTTNLPVRTAGYDKIAGAGSDEKTRKDLDIDWTYHLPDKVRNTIDAGFADDVAHKKLDEAVAKDAATKKVDTDYQAKKAKLKTDALAELKKKNPKATARDVEKDETYKEQVNQLEIERAQAKDARRTEIQTAEDASVHADQPKQTVARAPDTHEARSSGQAHARSDFMSWAVGVTGSPEAAEKHFNSIRGVKGTGRMGKDGQEHDHEMWLADDAATRFEAARAAFETSHPGYTFPTTGTAFEMRDLHQTRQPLGMLGHALGEAFDFWAVANPNIKSEFGGRTTSYRYLLEKFGGDGDHKGRATMSLDPGGSYKADATIQQMGKDTMAGKTTAEGDAMQARIRDQFGEMSATSGRFQASMADQMPALSAARDTYFNEAAIHKDLDAAKKDIAHGEQIAAKRLKDEKFSGTAEERAKRVAEIKDELADKKTQLEQQLQQSQAEVAATLKDSFAPWTGGIQKDLDHDHEKLAANHARIAAMDMQKKQLTDIKVADPDAMAKLEAYAAANGLPTPDKLKKPPKNATAYAAVLKSALGEQQAGDRKLIGADARQKDSDKYLEAEAAELDAWEQRLASPEFVFGKGVKQADGHWATKYGVESVPLMQLLENGFIRNDAMPDLDPKQVAGKDKKNVYNAEVMATLAQYGWSPGATYGDTMHFDYIQGYNEAAAGGRVPLNMNKPKYSPEGYEEPVKVQAPPKDTKTR